MNLDDWLRTDLEELGARVREVRATEAATLGQLARRAERVFVVGQGRSGLVMKMFAMRLMHLGLTTFVVGDATTPAIGSKDLLIVGSGSGETEGVLVAARRARETGAQIAALTSRPDSTLGCLADHVLLVPGATPKSNGLQTSKLPMATVLEQTLLIVADCVIAWLADQMGQTEETMMPRHANLE
jgi:6-phospho-3-hexuloisomerase